MVDKTFLENYPAIDKLVRQTAHVYFRKSYRISKYVFSTVEDAQQVGWVRLLESKRASELMAGDITGSEGLLCKIAQFGMKDYVRTVLGRDGKSNKNYKGKGKLATTYYMDYFNNDDNDTFDLPIASNDPSAEEVLIREQLMNELQGFMENKLSRRDKIIMDYLYKKEMTADEVGGRFAITESRVSQIRSAALEKLRDKYARE